MDRSYVAALENGRRRPPNAEGLNRMIKALDATDEEELALRTSAILSMLAKKIASFEAKLSGASTAMAILELSPVLTDQEIHALNTLLNGYRFRFYLKGENTM